MTTKRSVKDDKDSVHKEGMANLMGAREVIQQRASLFAAKSWSFLSSMSEKGSLQQEF
jgi:hypothetical protein